MYAYKDGAGSLRKSARGECIKTVKPEESGFFFVSYTFRSTTLPPRGRRGMEVHGGADATHVYYHLWS